MSDERLNIEKYNRFLYPVRVLCYPVFWRVQRFLNLVGYVDPILHELA